MSGYAILDCTVHLVELARVLANTQEKYAVKCLSYQKSFGVLVVAHYCSEAELKKIVFHHRQGRG
jgi:hypothetical protein